MKSAFLQIIDKLNLYRIFNYFTKNTATVFMLHRIYADHSSGNDDIDTSILQKFFSYLKSNRYNVISLSDYINRIRSKGALYKTVVFTVDDGYRDFYHNAYPIFKKFNFPAAVFITSDFIDKREMFWWDIIEYVFLNTSQNSIDIPELGISVMQFTDISARTGAALETIEKCKTVTNDKKWAIIQDLSKRLLVNIPETAFDRYEPIGWNEIEEMHSNNIEFFPHTKTHPILTQIDRKDAEVEIAHPKRVIEQHLNVKADIFCYPNGGESDFNDEIIRILKKYFYIAAFTGISGFDDTQKCDDLFRLKRFPLSLDEVPSKQYICGLERFKRKYIFPLFYR